MATALSRLLAARSWSDAQLAARTGLDRAHVNQLKNDRARPTVATALAIARALGVRVRVAFPPAAARAGPERRRQGGGEPPSAC